MFVATPDELQDVFRALGGGVDFDSDLGSGGLGGHFDGADGVVVMEGIVVVEQEVFDTACLAFLQTPFPSGVSPAFVWDGADAVVLVISILGVVEDDVGVFDQLLDIGVEVVEVFGVGGEGEDFDRLAGDVFLDAVAIATAGVVEGACGDDHFPGGGGDFDRFVIVEIPEVHLGGHVFELNGEVEVLLLAAEGFFEDAADEARGGVEAGPVEIEVVAGFECGEEKREALDVVPVDVTEEESGVDGILAFGQFEAEEAETGTPVDDDQAATGFDGDACGVPPVAGGHE